MSNWNDKSKAAWNKAWSNGNEFGSAMNLLGGIGNVAGPGFSNAQVKNIDLYDNQLSNFGKVRFNQDNFDNLLNDYSINMSPNIPEWQELTGSTGEKLGNTLSATASGAMTGLQIGGPWGALAGAVIGLGSGIGGWIIGDTKAQKEAERLNTIMEEKKIGNALRFNSSAANINDKMFNAASLNYRAYGGDLYDNAMITKHFNDGKVKRRKISYIGNMFAYGGQMKLGGDWSNGVTIIGEGGTHEMNPYDGVQVGIDDKGVPNLVEEGEVIFNDYVYSNRLKPTEKQLDEVKLDKEFNGLTFAEIAKKISKESEERPNDPISKNGLIDGMIKLQTIQEEIREKKAAAQFKRQFNKLSPEEQQSIAMQMMQPEGEVPIENAEPGFNFGDRYAANGNPQEQLDEEYGFAFGGNLFELGGIPYNNTKGFRYATYNNETGEYDYDTNYLNWLGQYDIENSPYWSKLQDIYKKAKGEDLTVQKARDLGHDSMFGPFHRAMQDMYEQSLADNAKAENIVRPESTADLLQKQAEANLAKITGQSDNNNIANDLLDQAEFSLREPLDKIEARPIDIILKDRRSSIPKLVNQRLNIKQGLSNDINDWLRYAPAIGSGITAIADLFGANRPDYTNANMIGDLSRRIRNVRAPQLYNYLRFNPYDVNYEQNRIQNIGLGTQRNILGTTSGNRSAALAGLLLGNNSTLSSIGDMFKTALEYNDNQRKTVSDFNRGTDQINLQSVLSAEQANQNADVQRANYILQQAKLKDEIDSATSAAISANRSNFFKNLGNIGNDNYYKAQTDWLIRSGAYPMNEQTKRYPNRKNGGKIRKPKRMI